MALPSGARFYTIKVDRKASLGISLLVDYYRLDRRYVSSQALVPKTDGRGWAADKLAILSHQ